MHYMAHRKGSVYVFVLSVALLVAGIGLGALQAMRTERRTVDLTEAAVQARMAAVSLVEVALLRISSDPAWRFTYTHDVWTTAEIHENTTCSFKLVDEQDADLRNDATQPVRLYTRATVGGATRIFSVLLRSDRDDAYASTVPSNGDMENGLTPWAGMGCDLEIHTDDSHGGAACLSIKHRDGTWDGPRQDIGDALTEDVTYEVEVWIKMQSFATNVRLVLWIDTNLDYYPVYYAQQSVGTGWTQVTGTITPSWQGQLEAAYWEIETATSTQDFMIDDAVMKPRGSDFDVSVIPGTWRREVLP